MTSGFYEFRDVTRGTVPMVELVWHPAPGGGTTGPIPITSMAPERVMMVAAAAERYATAKYTAPNPPLTVGEAIEWEAGPGRWLTGKYVGDMDGRPAISTASGQVINNLTTSQVRRPAPPAAALVPEPIVGGAA
jgi:hypothetical protein